MRLLGRTKLKMSRFGGVDLHSTISQRGRGILFQDTKRGSPIEAPSSCTSFMTRTAIWAWLKGLEDIAPFWHSGDALANAGSPGVLPAIR